MAVMHFGRVYLVNASRQLTSQWWSDVKVECSGSAANLEDTNAIFLPPMKPEMLKVIIELKHVEGSQNCDAEELARQLEHCLRNAIEFWHQLLYKVQFSVKGSTIQLGLTCQVWNPGKVSTLLEKPVENRPHIKNLPHIYFVQTLETFVDLTTTCEPDHLLDQVLPQLNEYLGSLFLSQLEFRFPFVFSVAARKRFLAQEAAIGPISYALSNSSVLLPILTKLISDDTTATTVFQMTKYSKSRIKNISFQIAKRQHSE